MENESNFKREQMCLFHCNFEADFVKTYS